MSCHVMLCHDLVRCAVDKDLKSDVEAMVDGDDDSPLTAQDIKGAQAEARAVC